MESYAQVLFSNRMEILLENLQKNLFSDGKNPFSNRLVVVPSYPLKQWMQLEIAKRLGVACGVEFSSLHHALHLLSSQLFVFNGEALSPSKLDLTLLLEQEIERAIFEGNSLFTPVRDYLEGGRKRLFSLADHLASHFLLYGVYGGEGPKKWEQEPANWQESLWKTVYQDWDYPLKSLPALQLKEVRPDLSVHLFCFGHLSRVHFSFLGRMGKVVPVFFYQLSPCREFWSDLPTDFEMRDDAFLEERHPLLANLGRAGRQMARTIEESDLLTQEEYEEIEPRSNLTQLQYDLLALEKSETRFDDDSLQIHIHASPRREIEVLYETLLSLMEKEELTPSEILVLAPDLNRYAHLIPSIFQKLPYSLTDLPTLEQNLTVKGLFLLFGLEKRRWSTLALFDLFSHPLFMRKQGWNEEDLLQIREWIGEVGIRWGVDKEHRNRLLAKRHAPGRIEDEEATWSDGIGLLLEELATGHDPKRIDFTQAELLGEMAEVVYALRADLEESGQEKTLPDWGDFCRKLLDTYFFHAEGEEKLFSTLQKLENASRHVGSRQYPFQTFERLLQSVLEEETATIHGKEIEAVQFCSIRPMRMIPSKVICLLGMDQERFPRKEPLSPFDLLKNEKTAEYLPSTLDFDRLFFLEAILSAREKLIVSYLGRDPYDLSERSPSSVVDELLSYVSPSQIYHHPILPYAPSTFFETGTIALESNFDLAKKFHASPLKTLTFPRLSSSPLKEKREVTIAQLQRFARSPLRTFLAARNLFWKYDPPLEEEEAFTLSPLKKAKLRRAFLEGKNPLQKTHREGEFPVGLFGEIAKAEWERERRALEKTLASERGEVWNLDPPLRIPMRDGREVVITGKLEGVASDGLCLPEKKSMSSALKGWPLYLLIKQIDPKRNKLLFTRTEDVLEGFFDDSLPYLQSYLEAYFVSEKILSPLFPDWIGPILEKNAEKLTKEIRKETFDPALQWLFRTYLPPDPEEMIEEWNHQTKELYGEMKDAWF